MSIWVSNDTRLLVQGITGSEGGFHAKGCADYGTKVVAGVTPGKGGQDADGVPVYNSVAEAREKTDCNATMIFVPPPFAADAIMEAADAGIELIVCITECPSTRVPARERPMLPHAARCAMIPQHDLLTLVPEHSQPFR